jgi:branched-chain amino acid transport system permease protein
MLPERIDFRAPRTIVVAILLLLLAAVPVLSQVLGQPYYVTLASRVVIYALAASSLNLVLGYGGMVTFGHALYFGLGAYALGILSFHQVFGGWIHLLVTLCAAVIVALITGLICLRTRGMAFIMITLAFAQMFFFLGVSLKQYGGDDGLAIARRSDFTPLFDLQSSVTLYYVALALLMLFLYCTWRLVHAHFGMVLRGAKANERRMRALGFPVLQYRLAAYVLSACVCSVAGLLLANLAKFTTPAYMAWTVSGELIVMVVLGGMGTVVGPVLGATALLLFEELMPGLLGTIQPSFKDHWLVVLGPVILLIVLLARRGIYGMLPGGRDAS